MVTAPRLCTPRGCEQQGRRGDLGSKGHPTSGRKNSTQRALPRLGSASSLRPPHSTPCHPHPAEGSDHRGPQASPLDSAAASTQTGGPLSPGRTGAPCPQGPAGRRGPARHGCESPLGPTRRQLSPPAPSVGNKHTFNQPPGREGASWGETSHRETGRHRNEANPAVPPGSRLSNVPPIYASARSGRPGIYRT